MCSENTRDPLLVHAAGSGLRQLRQDFGPAGVALKPVGYEVLGKDARGLQVHSKGMLPSSNGAKGAGAGNVEDVKRLLGAGTTADGSPRLSVAAAQVIDHAHPEGR